jgi:hypothetical protein
MSGSQHVIVLEMELPAKAQKVWFERAAELVDELAALPEEIGFAKITRSKSGVRVTGGFYGVDGEHWVEELFAAFEDAGSLGAVGGGFTLGFVDYQDGEGTQLTIGTKRSALKGKALREAEARAEDILGALADPGGRVKKIVDAQVDAAASLVQRAFDRLACAPVKDVWSAYVRTKANERIGFFIGQPKDGAALMKSLKAVVTKRGAPLALAVPLRLVTLVDRELGVALAREAIGKKVAGEFVGAAIEGLAFESDDAIVDLVFAQLFDPGIFPRTAATLTLGTMPNAKIGPKIAEHMREWMAKVRADALDGYGAAANARHLFFVASGRRDPILRDLLFEIYAELVSKPKPWDFGALRALAGREYLRSVVDDITDAKVRANVTAAITAAAGEDERPVHPAIRAARSALGLSRPKSKAKR